MSSDSTYTLDLPKGKYSDGFTF